MKKSIIALLTIASLAACNKAEVISYDKGEAISFTSPFVDNSTKAYDPSYGASAVALTQFNVWGTVDGKQDGNTVVVPVYTNTSVTGEVGINKTWTAAGVTQYWIRDAWYNFAAVVNGGANVTLGEDLLPESVIFTSDDNTDLLYSKILNKIQGQASNNPKVDFSFAHMLSKAVFTVTNTTNQNNIATSPYYYKVSNVVINQAVKTGTCTFENKSWSNCSNPASIEFGNITGTSAKTDSYEAAAEIRDRADKLTSQYERLLIPYDYGTNTEDVTTDDLSISFTVELYYENGTTDVLINSERATKYVAIKFVPGYSYSFNIEVGLGTPIEFSVTSNPGWEDGTDPTIRY